MHNKPSAASAWAKLSGRWQAFAGCARRLSPVRGCRPHVSSFACNPNAGGTHKRTRFRFFFFFLRHSHSLSGGWRRTGACAVTTPPPLQRATGCEATTARVSGLAEERFSIYSFSSCYQEFMWRDQAVSTITTFVCSFRLRDAAVSFSVF